MTDDKEERAMVCCPVCKLRMRVLVKNGRYKWQCSGCGGVWAKAPKHTDEEFNSRMNDFEEIIAKQQTRIKELEARVRHPKHLDQSLNEGNGVYRP